MSPPWHSPELALVAACCRWPPGPARTAAIDAAAHAGPDWPRVARIARRHRVVALVADGLASAATDVPPALLSAIQSDAASTARDNLRHAAVASELDRAFAAAGIPLLHLKGTTLALLAYGRLGLKTARDIDLLVAPPDEPAAEALLGQLGYRQIEPDPRLPAAQQEVYRRFEKETVWRHPVSAVTVDLHRRLVNYPRLLRLDRPGRQQVTLPGGGALATLAAPDLFAYLCAHGGLSGWFRLKWIADVAGLLAQCDAAGVRQLRDAATRAGVGGCAGQALLLCDRLFGTAIPADLLAALRADRRIAWLEQVALDAMGGACAEREVAEFPQVGRRIWMSYFRLSRDLRYRLEVARERWFCFEDHMRLPLPRPLHFLYPLLRVPLALERLVRRKVRA